MTHLLTGLSAVTHTADGLTQVRQARIYNDHPAHDGEYVCSIDFDLFVNEDGDIEFRHVYAVVNLGYARCKGITKVDPFHIKNAMENVLELLESGEISRLENEMIYSENEAVDM